MNKVTKNIKARAKQSNSVSSLKLKPVFQGNGTSKKIGSCTGCGGNVAFGLKLAVGF